MDKHGTPRHPGRRDRRNSLEWIFRNVGRMHFERIRSEMSHRGLDDVSHPRMLFILLHYPEHMLASQKEIADMMGVTPATVATSLRRMESRGLLSRIPDEKDQRRNHIELTPKGRERVEACIAAFADIDREMFNGFSDTEKEALLGYFQRIRGNLEEMGAQAPQATVEEGSDKSRQETAGGTIV